PQILGACRDNIVHARQIVETEMNGASDNPVTIGGDPLHGGNFQGQQIAFAADALNAAIVQIGVFAERLLDALTDPKRGVVDAPLLLAYDPGPTSGLAGVQMTATALVAELRHHAQMASTSSIPTNGGNQDIVSMGTLAARTAYDQTERLAPVLASVGLALSQLSFLRAQGRAPGTPVQAPAWMPSVQGLRHDRPLHDDLARIADAWLEPHVNEGASSNDGRSTYESRPTSERRPMNENRPVRESRSMHENRSVNNRSVNQSRSVEETPLPRTIAELPQTAWISRPRQPARTSGRTRNHTVTA
ncbi:MAG: aromatic amino acid lyase, partial [Bacteroidota bacterium]